MYLYNFCWSWYEEYSPNTLLHFEDKSQKEFEEDCKKAIIAVTEKLVIDGNRFGPEDNFKGWLGFSDIVPKAAEYMVNFGYVIPEIKTWGVFGGHILDTQEDGYNSEEYAEFEKLLGKELFQKVKDYNDEIRRKMDEEFERGK